MIIGDNTRLEGQTVIVTGAGNGIGAHSAELFAFHGANVVCADIDQIAVTQVAERINVAGGRALSVAVDVTNYEDCLTMADKALAEFGQITGIYANAGIHGAETAEQISVEAWKRVIDIDLTGAFLSVKAVLPTMLKQQRGSIVLQASICATSGIKGTVSYSAAKAGLVGLGFQMAVEYAEQGLRVNCISPGTTPTQLVETLYTERAARRGTTAESDLAKTAAGYPMKRLGTTGEIANLALFLLSDEASFITGTNIPIDGGFSAS